MVLGDASWWSAVLVAVAVVFLGTLLWLSTARPGTKTKARRRGGGAPEAAAHPGGWRLLARGKKVRSVQVDESGLHAFWLAATEDSGFVVRRQVLQGCLVGLEYDEPRCDASVSAFAPHDGGVALFDARGGVWQTVPENEIVRLRDGFPAHTVDGVTAEAWMTSPVALLDTTRARRSHCGGWLNAALVGARDDSVFAVDLTKPAEDHFVFAGAGARILDVAIAQSGGRCAWSTRRGIFLGDLGADRKVIASTVRALAARPGDRMAFSGAQKLFVLTDGALCCYADRWTTQFDHHLSRGRRVLAFAPTSEESIVCVLSGDGPLGAAAVARPAGLRLEPIPSLPSLPLADENGHHDLESIAVAPDGSFLLVALQQKIIDPDEHGDRILRIDLPREKPSPAQ